MTTLRVFVKTCSEATGWLELGRGGSVTAHIPVRNQENLIRIQKKFAGWKVELSRAHPGFGKPYLVLLTNENKVCRNCVRHCILVDAINFHEKQVLLVRISVPQEL